MGDNYFKSAVKPVDHSKFGEIEEQKPYSEDLDRSYTGTGRLSRTLRSSTKHITEEDLQRAKRLPRKIKSDQDHAIGIRYESGSESP